MLLDFWNPYIFSNYMQYILPRSYRFKQTSEYLISFTMKA